MSFSILRFCKFVAHTNIHRDMTSSVRITRSSARAGLASSSLKGGATKTTAPRTKVAVKTETDSGEIAVSTRKPVKRSKKEVLEPSPFVAKNLQALCAKAQRVLAVLNELYPSPKVPLNAGSPFQFLCAVVLSAQTTDAKVNTVTPRLFELAPTPGAMGALDQGVIAAIIQPLGLSATKSKHLHSMSQMLVERFDSQLPRTYPELESLPGVGHKTASVIMSHCFGVPAFPVDTHIHRLAERWRFSSGRSVEQTEADLKVIFPEDSWNKLHLQLIWFGREHCPARSHDASTCPICSWVTDSG